MMKLYDDLKKENESLRNLLYQNYGINKQSSNNKCDILMVNNIYNIFFLII